MAGGVFMVLVCCIVISAGSKIEFSTQPSSVTPSLTSELTLTCDLRDTDPVTSSGLVGRDLHNVTQTNVNMQARVVNTWSNIVVVGGVDAGASVKGFLNISISTPLVSQLGEFSCEVHSVHPGDLQDVKFSQSVTVSAVAPSLAQWMEHVHQLESAGQTHRAQVDVMGDLLTCLTCGTCPPRQVDSLKQNITGLGGNSQCWAVSPGSVSMDDHIEIGNLVRDISITDCNNAAIQFNFTSPYTSPPNVYLWSDDGSTFLINAHTTVSRSGFRFDCNAVQTTTNKLNSRNIHQICGNCGFNSFSWISFSKQTTLMRTDDKIVLDGFGVQGCTYDKHVFRSAYSEPPAVYMFYFNQNTSPSQANRIMLESATLNGVVSVDETGVTPLCGSAKYFDENQQTNNCPHGCGGFDLLVFPKHMS